jgi:hypothetical protein
MEQCLKNMLTIYVFFNKRKEERKMKTLVVTLAVALFTFGCNAQSENKKNTEQTEVIKEQKKAPNESWTVKKELDENGNVIGYDSVYTWSYNNIEGDSVYVDVDSMMRSIDSYFGENMPSVWNRSFMKPMFSDSLLARDLFSDKYFEDRWKSDFFDIEEMFQHMDSIRNRFLEQNFPHINQNLPTPNKGKSNNN